MGRKRQESRGKKIKPQYWVFCEGKTEEAYVNFLRSKYRIPIEIVSKITGSNLNEKRIKAAKKGKPVHEKDLDFLLYDGDVVDVLDRLKKIANAHLLISNPTIELWFLLHYKNQTAHISCENCIGEISRRNRIQYKKGLIDNKLSEKLSEKYIDACKRARNLNFENNPSSNVYEFIEILEKETKEHN
ncbi:RloB family protein [Labilibaculum sp.]|uniref:RloB family protein n=1 Tax=Labilibaculum sp. TaxID=2060723 RepID=UPI00356B1989